MRGGIAVNRRLYFQEPVSWDIDDLRLLSAIFAVGQPVGLGPGLWFYQEQCDRAACPAERRVIDPLTKSPLLPVLSVMFSAV